MLVLGDIHSGFPLPGCGRGLEGVAESAAFPEALFTRVPSTSTLAVEFPSSSVVTQFHRTVSFPPFPGQCSSTFCSPSAPLCPVLTAVPAGMPLSFPSHLLDFLFSILRRGAASCEIQVTLRGSLLADQELWLALVCTSCTCCYGPKS